MGVWPFQCCGKSQILVRPTDHPWLTVGWSISVLGGPSINNLVRPWNHLQNWSKWANRKPRFYSGTSTNIDGLVQDCSISSALAMEILQSCAKPWIWYQCICGVVCPLFFLRSRIHWSPNRPSMVGLWVACWIHGLHLATGRPYFSSTAL